MIWRWFEGDDSTESPRRSWYGEQAASWEEQVSLIIIGIGGQDDDQNQDDLDEHDDQVQCFMWR